MCLFIIYLGIRKNMHEWVFELRAATEYPTFFFFFVRPEAANNIRTLKLRTKIN